MTKIQPIGQGRKPPSRYVQPSRRLYWDRSTQYVFHATYIGVQETLAGFDMRHPGDIEAALLKSTDRIGCFDTLSVSTGTRLEDMGRVFIAAATGTATAVITASSSTPRTTTFTVTDDSCWTDLNQTPFKGQLMRTLILLVYLQHTNEAFDY